MLFVVLAGDEGGRGRGVPREVVGGRRGTQGGGGWGGGGGYPEPYRVKGRWGRGEGWRGLQGEGAVLIPALISGDQFGRPED